MLSLLVQLLPDEQLRLLTRRLGGEGSSPLTSSPEPAASGLGITPHSIRVKPAPRLSCSNKCLAAISEQSMPVEVIWAWASDGPRLHAATINTGSAKYRNTLLLPFVFILFLSRF